MNEIMNEEIIEKLKFYLNKKQSVHINLKNGKFYNADIKDIGADFAIIEDFKFGELPLFFVEVHSILPYKKP